jgi:ABC-2 type transport system ATP-binding protein
VAGCTDDPRFYPYLTARQNLHALGILDGLAAAERQRRTAELLERVGLAASADRKLAGYSLGMRQRLGLASALLREPSVLVLDEPTNGLDPAGTSELWSLLRTITEAGGAVLLSSHDLAVVEAVCHAVTITRDGRALWTGLSQTRPAACRSRPVPGSSTRSASRSPARASGRARSCPASRRYASCSAS